MIDMNKKNMFGNLPHIRPILSPIEHILLRPKKNHVFRATRPYLLELADPRLFYENIGFFSLGSL